MQGAFELGLVAVLFLGLQVWWLSKVFLNRPRQPKPLGKPMRANTLQGERMPCNGCSINPEQQQALAPSPQVFLVRDGIDQPDIQRPIQQRHQWILL